MAQQELHGSQVAGSPVDERRLRPSQEVGVVEADVQADPSDPLLWAIAVTAGSIFLR